MEAQTGRLCCAGKLHGYGFVQFETQAAAEQACQLHGSDFMGRQLTVDVATAAEGGKAPTGTPVEGCWFCLSNPNADVNLVASIGALYHSSWTPVHCSPPNLVCTPGVLQYSLILGCFCCTASVLCEWSLWRQC